MNNQYEDYQMYYSENKLMDKLAKSAKRIGLRLTYSALLLYYVLEDPKVSIADKAKIYGALGYFILPLDLIPDMIPVTVYSDDVSAVLWALHSVWKNVTPEMKMRAKRKMTSWLGINPDEEIIIFKKNMTPTCLQTAQEAMTQRIYAYAREMKLSSDVLSHELCMNGDTIDAIPDGVYSAERYLKARKRIMWVLKEPYDEISELGYPCGGGWQVSEAFDAPGAWKNPTWQSMIYATYGILKYCCPLKLFEAE